MNPSTITLKAKQFFNQNYGWILLITGIIALVLANGGDCFKDFMIGFSKGVREGNPKEDANYSPNVLTFFIVIPVILIIFSSFIIIVGNFFYQLFFKYILQKSSPLYIRLLAKVN